LPRPDIVAMCVLYVFPTKNDSKNFHSVPFIPWRRRRADRLG
jgi:hypothetical protein